MVSLLSAVFSGAFDTDLCVVFVKGLPRNDHEDVEAMLWSLFESFEPQAVNLISPKGVAYVRVSSGENVRRAIKQLHGESIAAEGSEAFTLSLMVANE